MSTRTTSDQGDSYALIVGESLPYLHGLKPAAVQSTTVQSYAQSGVDAQNDAHLTSGR